ncbi:MAG: class I SAM-dependent methyltransferase [Nocardioidaceae bacterium]|nr:class I SAM-dependent methyltransferase [Nocardioidaceae bacterium]
MSTRWSQVAGEDGGDAYAARFAALATAGQDVHGEAHFCASLASPGARVLDAGCGSGRVTLELHRRGYEVVGVDVDPSMLRAARRAAPELTFLEGDLAGLDALDDRLGGTFDLVVAAGNVVPLLASGTEPQVVRRLAACLRPAGLVVAGFGLDADHLPLSEAPLTLTDYDRCCTSAGLRLVGRFATWQGEAYEGGGYAVSVHQHAGR